MFFIVHPLFAGELISDPLQLLQLQIQRSVLFRPRRVFRQAQSTSGVSFGGSINGPATVTPAVAAAPSSTPANTDQGGAASSAKTVKSSA